MDLSSRKLSGPVVSRLARISDATFRQWRKRGLIAAAATPNAWPTFSVLEALKVTLIAELGRSGVDLRFAAQIAETVDMIEDVSRLRKTCVLQASGSAWHQDDEGRMHAADVSRPALALAVLGTEKRLTFSEAPGDTVLIAVDVAKVFKQLENDLSAMERG